MQGTLFEEDYLLKTAGLIVKDYDYAITEIIANAWDAGATRVRISIPPISNNKIIIEDNGHGMTPDDFEKRWMCLGYNRVKKQGQNVEFPEGLPYKRKAFGKNGIGRHAMFCFCDSYTVCTMKDGIRSEYDIEISKGENPWIITPVRNSTTTVHGTILSGTIIRNLPDLEKIRNTISSSFCQDPDFQVFLNGQQIDLSDYSGLHDPEYLKIDDFGTATVHLVESEKSARTKQLQGFAFRVNNRLVGNPSWIIDPYAPIDSRTQFGRRFSILVDCNFMENLILPDWSQFFRGPEKHSLFKALNDYAIKKYGEYCSEKVDDTKTEAFSSNLHLIKELTEPQKNEIEIFVNSVMQENPTIKPSDLSTSISSFVKIQQTKNGQHLLDTIANMNENDVNKLDEIITEWSVQDISTVLTEIDRRLATIAAIQILAEKNDTDELHVLHPLITEARWLFGPEYDSCEYVFNNTIKNAVNKIFGVNTQKSDYENYKKRPDLIALPDASVSATGIEEFDESGLSRTRRLLLIEVKKGKFQITRKEISQAQGYVDDMRASGFLPKNCFYSIFVLGDSIANNITPYMTLGSGETEPTYGKIQAETYSTLVDTANRRMFRIKDVLKQRYDGNAEKSSLLKKLITSEAVDLPFDKSEVPHAN